MFGKTIHIEKARNGQTNFIAENSTGYNTQRYDRYPQQDSRNIQRKTITSGQFTHFKKPQTKTNQLIIRECDVNELNNFKKNTPRTQQGSFQAYGNSSSKKQRINLGFNPRKGSQAFKQPLQQIRYSQKDNVPHSYSRYSSSSIDQFQNQIQYLKQFIFQNNQEQTTNNKQLRIQVQGIHTDCMGELENFARQISEELTKQKEEINLNHKLRHQTQRELKYLKDSFNAFVKDNQEKIESIVNDLNANGVKKSRNHQQFDLDLKSSNSQIGGVGTSISMNFQNQNINVKLYNQMAAQIQLLKHELDQTKIKIETVQINNKDIQMISAKSVKTIQEPQKSTKNDQKIDFKEIQRLITDKLTQERKKNSLNQKFNDLDLRTKDLYKVYQDIDTNIKGMNAQFTRVINGTVIKKQKLLQSKLNIAQQKINQLFTSLNPIQLQQTTKNQVKRFLEDKSSKTRIIKVREQTVQQKTQLQSLKASNITYMLDGQGYLMDQCGNYIVQSNANGKSKIKIQKDLIYLLQTQGMQIKVI